METSIEQLNKKVDELTKKLEIINKPHVFVNTLSFGEYLTGDKEFSNTNFYEIEKVYRLISVLTTIENNISIDDFMDFIYSFGYYDPKNNQPFFYMLLTFIEYKLNMKLVKITSREDLDLTYHTTKQFMILEFEHCLPSNKFFRYTPYNPMKQNINTPVVIDKLCKDIYSSRELMKKFYMNRTEIELIPL